MVKEIRNNSSHWTCFRVSCN